MTAVGTLDLHRGQLDDVLQETLLRGGGNLVEFIEVDDEKLRHRLQHLPFLREDEVVVVAPLQLPRQETAAERALVVALFRDEQGNCAVAVLVDAVGAPLFHHAEEPDVEPVRPVRVVGGHGACEGADVVLAVPFAVAVEEVFVDGVVVADIVRLQVVSHVLDAHADIGELHL